MAIVASPRRRHVASARLPPIPRVLLIALAALSVVHIDAVRLDARSMGKAQGKPSRHKAAKTPNKTAGDQITPATHREQQLRWAYDYVQTVRVTDSLKLSAMKDTIDRLETLRQGVSEGGSFIDPEKRKMLRIVLRDIRLKLDALKVLVAMQGAAGEVDDGGDILPSERPCILIVEDVEADEDVVCQIGALCDALNAVRQAFAAQEFEEAAVFDIVRRMASIKSKGWYANPIISWRINLVLNEEKRWVTKEIAARTAQGEPFERIAEMLDMWMGEDFDVNPNSYALTERENALRKAYEIAMGTIVENGTNLSALRTANDRLQYYEDQLKRFLPVSGPPFTDRVHALLNMYQTKIRLIRGHAKNREAEGDVDDGGEVPPSRRVNICGRIDEYNITEELKSEIKEICAKLDGMREVVLNGGDAHATLFGVVRRANALRALPGYAEMPIAGGLEFMLDEEGRWAEHRWDVENNRPKEPPLRFITAVPTAVPTAPPPPMAAAMGDSAQKALKFVEARQPSQTMGVESSFNFNVRTENVDLMKEEMLATGAPQIENVDAQRNSVNEDVEQLGNLVESLQADGSEEDKLVSELELGSQGDEEDNLVSKLELESLGAAEGNLASEFELGSSGAEEGNLIFEHVLEPLDSQDDNFISRPGPGSLDEGQDNLLSEPELGPQFATGDSVISEDVMAAPCQRLNSHGTSPEVRAQFEEICGEKLLSRSTVSDHGVASGSWTRAVGDIARRLVAFFTAGPPMGYDAIFGLLPQQRSELGAPLDAGADGAEVANGADVAAQTPRTPEAPASAGADGVNNTVQ